MTQANSIDFQIIYSKFDVKIGPMPVIWVPETVSRPLRDAVASESMNINFSGIMTPESLAIFPLPEHGCKIAVRSLKYQDLSTRGGEGEVSLSLVFAETYDSIVYRYIKDFEALINEFANEIASVEESKSGLQAVKPIIAELHDRLLELVNRLRAQEVDQMEATAFPSVEEPACQPAKTIKLKVIVIGDPSVGKTSLVLRFTDRAFRRTYMPTIGTNLSEKLVDFCDFKINFVIWDIAGQAKFSRMRQQFYAGASGFFIVFDLTNQESFKSVAGWVKDVRALLGPVPGFILANKRDLAGQRVVSEADILALQEELDCTVLGTSAASGEGVTEAFRALGQVVHDLIES